MNDSAYIELNNITKTFGSVVANKNVSLSVGNGEIHALLGENGSGKSTLVNMLSGIYTPDSGFICMKGRKIEITSPHDAIQAGIGMVHQHFKLVEVLSAKENIVTGCKNRFFINSKKLSKDISALAEKYGLEIDPDKMVYDMSVSEKQTVEILKVLYRGASLLILDEPTAVLTPQEITHLFDILRNMREKGCSIIIITHKLNEVMEISDKVTVLRKGESIATVDTVKTNAQQLTEMMVGRAINLQIKRSEISEETKKILLEVESLSVSNEASRKTLKDVSFELYSGEILGVAGVAGSGQKELCEAIAGLCKSSGSILLKGEELVGLNPRIILKKGISMSFVPEDRLGMGLVEGMDIVDNVLLKSYRNKRGIGIDRKAGRALAERIIKKFDVQTPSVNHIIKKLSGGNIQKVLLGREIDSNPQVLITAYPARGLDIGASYNIYNVLNEQKEALVGILYIGEDLDVILELCDRIMVLSHGEIIDIVDAKKVTKEEIGLMMLGQKPHKEEAAG